MNASTQHITDNNNSHQAALTLTSTPLRFINLKHFVDTALSPSSNVEDIASVIERDPLIFSHYLRLNPLASEAVDCWFDGIELSLFPAIALSMSSDFIHRIVNSNVIEHNGLWLQSIQHSLLAEAICLKLDQDYATQAKLAGLMANIADVLALELNPEQDIKVSNNLITEVNQSGKQSAELVKHWGCTANFCDAIRYHNYPLSELVSTAPLIQSVACARHMLNLLQTDTTTEYNWQELEPFGLPAEDCLSIIDDVNQTITQLYPDSYSHEEHYQEFENTFHDAALTAIYDSTVTNTQQDEVLQTVSHSADYLFSISQCYPLQPQADVLLVTVGSEEIHIPIASENSLAARAYHTSEIQVIYPENCLSIQDNQLLERCGNEAIICVPLKNTTGVMLCALKRNAVQAALEKPQLLSSLCQTIAADHEWQCDKEPSNEQLELENEIKERINKLIHEANNPFAVIQNYLHSLSFKLGQDSPLQKEIDIITAEISRTSDIISSFKDIGARKKATLETVDVNEVIQQLMSLIQGSNQNIQFELDLDSNDCLVQSHPDDIKQILINLIKNAVECFEQFKPAQAKPTITVTTTHTINVNGKPYQEIIIADNGPGIPVDIQNNLFKQKQTTKANGHFGLGLNIVVDLIEKLDAMITCKSRDSKSSHHGTIFTLLIPHVAKVLPSEQSSS